MDNTQISLDEKHKSHDANIALNKSSQVQGQPVTSDDISNTQRSAFDEGNLGESTSIGTEDFEEDGGADLGFGETDVTEDQDRESPLRRGPGGSTSDGSNEENSPVGIIEVLSGNDVAGSSKAEGSGTNK